MCNEVEKKVILAMAVNAFKYDYSENKDSIEKDKEIKNGKCSKKNL